MILKVEHELKYEYSSVVGLNPHYLYLNPRPNPYQKILDFNQTISPEPNLIVKNVDQESNIQQVCFFNTQTDRLDFKTTFTIESKEFSTLNFVFYPFETSKLPFQYKGKLGFYSAYFLNNKIFSPQLIAFANDLALKANFVTLDFLIMLVSEIPTRFKYNQRDYGDPMTSEETLKKEEGTCRDFAVLMIDVCSVLGIVAQFVSGYLYGSENNLHDLHAWVEVLLPGGGWRGFDPTVGRMVDNQYVALASSVEPIGLNPVRGTFRAEKNVNSMLNTKVTIEKLA